MHITPFILRLLTFVVFLQSDRVSGQEPTARVIHIGTIPDQMRFDTEWIGVVPGERVVFEFQNTCRMQHNLVICRPGNAVTMRVAQAAWRLGVEAIEKHYVPDHPAVLFATTIVNPGETSQFAWTVPETEGDYPFVCTLPGHALTMKGILHVGAPNDTPPDTGARVDSIPASAVERAKQVMRRYRPLMDGGPAISGVISQGSVKMIDGSPLSLPTTNRGIAIRIGDEKQAAVLFDSERLRYTAGWVGPVLQFLEGREDERAEYRYQLGAAPHFILGQGLGWADSKGNWTDPRPSQMGPLPKKHARYRGQYRAGDRVILHYEVHGVKILDTPSFEQNDTFSRTLLVGPSDQTLQLRLAQSEGIQAWSANMEELSLNERDGYHQVTIAPRARAIQFQVSLSRARPQAPPPLNLNQLITEGNTGHAFPPIRTQGRLGEDSGPYTVDTLTLPYENPWNALLYTSGHDFFSNGDAAVCASHGDVWTVSGINRDLDDLQWRRIATGLANPLGLRIVNDQIYVTSLHEITRLHDSDHDGLADYYETFNADCEVSSSHHRFATDLQTDSQGNFYYLKCSDEGQTAHGGSLIRVSSDGENFELFATGLRNPNGMGIGPDDTITFGKQQGTWIPTSGIHMVERGKFYGYVPSSHTKIQPTEFESPLCWIPHGIDNSCGGQVWAPPGDRWGPLGGNLLHFSYGKCQMFLVLHEEIDNIHHGGVIRIPGVQFESGAMRGRFRSQDGQLYVSGLRGWQTTATMPGCLQRVRYTGQPSYLPSALRIESKGIRISFNHPLDPATTENPSRYSIAQWNYRWTKNYGSPDFKVSNPEEQGRDRISVDRVALSEDGKSVLIEIPELQPVMQMEIRYRLQTMDGAPVEGAIYNTIHRVP